MEHIQMLVSQMTRKNPMGSVGDCNMTLTELKAKALNDECGTLAMGSVDCPICKNKGYVAIVRDGELFTRDCECMAKRRSIKRMQASGLADLLRDYTLEAYQTPEPWQKAAKSKAMDYVASGMGHWFVVTGTPGTGKTHLCTAIAGKMIDAGKEVRYMLWREDAPKLKASVMNDREYYDRIMDAYKSVDVLYIDDFFKGGNVTDADVSLAFELLNARYIRAQSMTLISSEKTVEQFLDIDEAVGSRIYERSKGFCMKMPVANWRLRNTRG